MEETCEWLQNFNETDQHLFLFVLEVLFENAKF